MNILPEFSKNFKDKLKTIKKYIVENGNGEESIDMVYILDIESILNIDTEIKYAGTFYDKSEDDNFILFQTKNCGGGITPLSFGFSVGFLEDDTKAFTTIIHNMELFGVYIKIIYKDCKIEDLCVYKDISQKHSIYNSSIPKRLPFSLKDDLEDIDIFDMDNDGLTHLRFLI